LTTRPINCSNLSRVSLQFQRWLGVEGNTYDHATIQVSNDKTNWTTIWENPASDIADKIWVLQEFDISDIADGEPRIFIRWTMGPTDSSYRFCGWNIDDVEIVAIPAACPEGDLDGNCRVDFNDVKFLAGRWLDGPGSPADIIGSDGVNWGDFTIIAMNWGAAGEPTELSAGDNLAVDETLCP